MGRRATRGHERLFREIVDGTQVVFETDERQVASCDGKVVDKRGNINAADRHTFYVVLTDRRLLLFLLLSKAFSWGLARPPELIAESTREHARASLDRQRADLSMSFSDGLTVGPTFTMRITAQSTFAYAVKIDAALSPVEPAESAESAESAH